LRCRAPFLFVYGLGAPWRQQGVQSLLKSFLVLFMISADHEDKTPQNGVFESDAPEGYTALVAYEGGQRVLRVEIHNNAYTAAWVPWLMRWLARRAQGGSGLHLLP